MPFDSIGFSNDQPPTPRKRHHVFRAVTTFLALPFVSVLVWQVWLAARDTFNNFVVVAAMSRLP
ncbi:MAG TPA: hypothetical protein VFL55_19045 [Acetobacteraceae bacterium]|nr:hypothetical protein [Acetobacteraceae bacterium]